MTEQIYFTNSIRQILKYWTIIVMAGLIAAFGLGIVASRIYRPQFETQAIIVVYNKSAGSSVNSAQETAEVFREVITSSVLQKKVAQAMGVESLPGTISCANIPNTNMITLKVQASAPQDAMLVMNGILDNYENVSAQLLVNMVLQVLEEPQVPMQATEAYDEWNVLGKIFLGTVAGIASILAFYFYFRDDIKSEEQVEKKLDTKLFGAVYHENMKKGFHILPHKKKKTGILVTSPVTSFGYTETFQKLCMKLEYKVARKNQKVILVTSVQENEGKSTVSVNLALSLAKRGKRVLLVDVDLRKPAQFKLLGQTYGRDSIQIGDVLAGKGNMEDAVRKVSEDGLLLLGGSRSYKNATKLLVSRAAGQVFDQLADDVDYVILDTPPLYLAADTEEMLQYADSALLVVRQNGAKVKDINDAVDIVKSSGCVLLGCVLNDVENGLLDGAVPYSDGYRQRYGYGYGYYKKQKESKEQA